MEHFLFDLDGTLLPMKQEEFVKFYLPLLAARFQGRGIAPDKLIGAVWNGFGAMVMNDGRASNEEVFWNCFSGELGIRRSEVEEDVLDFYGNDFNQAIRTTSPDPVANEIVKYLKSRGKKVYLATNPVFPRCATMNRIRWAGLDAEDFELITTYETCRYSKPNVEYYRGILSECGLDPEECLMVGNDRKEDLAAGELGIHTYLVTGCLEHGDAPARGEYEGESLSQLYEDLKGLV